MSSKYDEFWLARLEEIKALLGDAAQGRAACADFSSIRPLGERASWAGTATIHGAVVVKVAMAHVTSLARVVADAGLCLPWPDQTFVFSMSTRGVLTIRPQSMPTSSIATPTPMSVTPSVPSPVQPAEEEPHELAEACRGIHEVLDGLPRYTDPSEVPIANGLYFFFELGENSPHGHPRITRIGNHPRAQDGLVSRLRNHYATYRGAKNGSVFRRYLGGALLRRDGCVSCLDPTPGKGHWERGDGQECDVCAPYERLVTERLRSTFSFSCVRVEDRTLRNHLEERLIAAVSRCPLCQPSSDWLGRLAYPQKVQSSGMWNSDFVEGLPATKEDLVTLRGLAGDPSGHRDLSHTLLLIPCSAGKRGTGDLGLIPASIESFIGTEAASVLAEGRARAFQRTFLDRASAPIPALARYSGQPYKTPGVIDGILEAVSRGLHVLIVSGGYGLLRAEEPIQRYEAQMQKTLTVWRSRIPAILRDYVARNGIRQTFGAFSTVYSATVPERLTDEDWRAVPSLDELGGGFAMTRIPERVAQLILDLLQEDLAPGRAGWTLASSV